MKTPISDFVTEYAASDTVRFHMPGHKGSKVLGCERLDITEVSGADALYEASGIIAESEKNATKLFGTGRTLYSTEGSSQCIRAMLELARRWWQRKQKEELFKVQLRPVVVAARNVHKSFIYAATLLDFEIVWLYGEEENPSLCSCVITEQTLRRVLAEKENQIACVYITSPNYLGGMADIASLANVCHEHNTLLCVDNAHGAYLHFLEQSLHPMDLGADLCCDSAHKTLPVLTGGAYLHISKNAPAQLKEWAKGAMELFGSTSPSYLILQSLDLCNAYLAGDYKERLRKSCGLLAECRKHLIQAGWQVEKTDPLRLTISASEEVSGVQLADRLRDGWIECEYADEDYLVLMATPENKVTDFDRLLAVLGENKESSLHKSGKKIPMVCSVKTACTVREAYFSEGEILPVEQAEGRICRMPTAACPPAIPVVVPGEQINKEAIQSFLYYGIQFVDVIKE